MTRSIMLALIAAVALFSLSALPAHASYSYCANGATISADQRTCSDGSLPIFVPDTVAPAPAPRMVRSNRHNYPNPGFFRTWYLFVPGTVYEGPSSVPGYNVLTTSFATGVLYKLSIFRNGRFYWDSRDGTRAVGRWLRGTGNYPIVLYSYEGKPWGVEWDPNQNCLFVADGETWFEAKP